MRRRREGYQLQQQERRDAVDLASRQRDPPARAARRAREPVQLKEHGRRMYDTGQTHLDHRTTLRDAVIRRACGGGGGGVDPAVAGACSRGPVIGTCLTIH